MSKTITIPKDRDPFVVIVNGVEYKYPAGQTVTVPDSVADVIEKYENAKPKPDPNPAPGGSVQSDWNQNDSSAADFIKNRTHYKREIFVFNQQEYTTADMDGIYAFAIPTDTFFPNGKSVNVYLDGAAYPCTIVDMIDFAYCGNKSLTGMGDDNGYPFFCLYQAGNLIVVITDSAETVHTFGIAEVEVVKIPSEYLSGFNTFYVSDEYLHSDGAMMNRLTNSELKKAVKAGVVTLSDGYSETYASVFIEDRGDYSEVHYVLFYDSDEPRYSTAYTAEYTG